MIQVSLPDKRSLSSITNSLPTYFHPFYSLPLLLSFFSLTFQHLSFHSFLVSIITSKCFEPLITYLPKPSLFLFSSLFLSFSDWVWVVPPAASSLTPVYHQEMLYYNLKPSYEYQVYKHFKSSLLYHSDFQ